MLPGRSKFRPFGPVFGLIGDGGFGLDVDGLGTAVNAKAGAGHPEEAFLDGRQERVPIDD